MRGRGQAYDDPAALLRGEPGRPVELTMDLIWTTAGTPYQYRITPRYEIPCTVSGTVTVDGRDVRRERPCRGSATTPGACGTGGHGLGVERTASRATAPMFTGWTSGSPVRPPIGIGYMQPPGEALVELQAVTARETFGDNGLPRAPR